MTQTKPHPVEAEGAPVPSLTPQADPAHLVLKFKDQPVRVVMQQGAPWFASKDICRALGLRVGEKTSPAKHTQFLADEDQAHAVLPTPSGPQRCAIISLEGVQDLTRKRKRRLDQQLRSWAGREAAKLVPKPAPTEPALPSPVVLLPAGSYVMFKDVPIRFARLDELPWYSAEDVAHALDLPLALTLETKVAECHTRLAPLSTQEGYETGPVLSPIGAWTLTLIRGVPADYAFQMFVFKQTKLLQPDAFDRERYGAAQCMALRPDGDVPPRPHPRSGRVDEWQELKWAVLNRDFAKSQGGRKPAEPRSGPQEDRATIQASLLAEANASRASLEAGK